MKIRKQNKCKFDNCQLEINEWDKYCDYHKKFIRDVIEAIECNKEDVEESEHNKEFDY